MVTQTIVVEDFAKEMERALRAVLPTTVKDIRITPKSIYVCLEERQNRTCFTRSFGVDNHGDWTMRAVEWSLDGRSVTESGHIWAYSAASREGLARKVADWFSRDFAEVVPQ